MPDKTDGNTPKSPISPREASYFDYLAEEKVPQQLSFSQMFMNALMMGTGSVLPWEGEKDIEG